MMPPPRYHFPVVDQPARPWPGQTLQARRFISGKMSQIARFASLETPPFRSLEVGSCLGFGAWSCRSSWELPTVMLPKKTLNQRRFSTVFGRRFGVPCLLLFHLIMCFFFGGGFGQVWNLTKFDLGFLFEQLGGCSFTCPLSSTDALAPGGLDSERNPLMKENVLSYESGTPIESQTGPQTKNQLIHPGLNGYMFLFIYK